MKRVDPRDETLRSGLRRIHPPDEADALERAIVLSSAEHAEARRSGGRRIPVGRSLAALVATASVVVLALTPAGAQVRHWVGDAVDGLDEAGVRPALTHVPAGGSLLVSSGSERFSVGEDGSTHLLGTFDDVAWSPHGVFVAAARDRELLAIEPDGDLRWRIDAPGPVEDPTWAPGCCRVGYRSAGGLWVVNGDGTDPHELVDRVAAVAPAWKPATYDIETQTSQNVLAYVDDHDRLVTIDADTAATSATARLAAEPISIAWLDRERILVVEPGGLEIVDARAGTATSLPVQLRGRSLIKSAAVALGGRSIALLTESGGPAEGSRLRSTLQLWKLGPEGEVEEARTLFTGLGSYDGPLFAPDGSRIELGWRQADQWRFISPEPGVEPIAVGGITREFDPGSRVGAELPRIDGWCCS